MKARKRVTEEGIKEIILPEALNLSMHKNAMTKMMSFIVIR
jgi:hypothetical protein